MPRKPRRPCRHPGCPNLCEDGEQYCEKHRKEAERQYKHFTRGYSAGKRYGRQWKKIRDRKKNIGIVLKVKSPYEVRHIWQRDTIGRRHIR